jgi:hypothetical protein
MDPTQTAAFKQLQEEHTRLHWALAVECGKATRLPPGWTPGKNGAHVKVYPSGHLGVAVAGTWHLWEKTDRSGAGTGRRLAGGKDADVIARLYGMELCDAAEINLRTT